MHTFECRNAIAFFQAKTTVSNIELRSRLLPILIIIYVMYTIFMMFHYPFCILYSGCSVEELVLLGTTAYNTNSQHQQVLHQSALIQSRVLLKNYVIF